MRRQQQQKRGSIFALKSLDFLQHLCCKQGLSRKGFEAVKTLNAGFSSYQMWLNLVPSTGDTLQSSGERAGGSLEGLLPGSGARRALTAAATPAEHRAAAARGRATPLLLLLSAVFLLFSPPGAKSWSQPVMCGSVSGSVFSAQGKPPRTSRPRGAGSGQQRGCGRACSRRIPAGGRRHGHQPLGKPTRMHRLFSPVRCSVQRVRVNSE